ncbi:D-arabinono-1,4-lactone oxidase [uncultured Chitinophaga sp.]|jgi:FAD/FMN-containing dehydrogenases|uniref:D-arabinono-1,4-lactone oxidase n=1 Tax=uncultured Chitinophaga sp. TaxID=339340 RepID=UPI00260E549F|nr:D-arabinono-1,4-lactone oxidase [uncultured Chitinophaga sp.]
MEKRTFVKLSAVLVTGTAFSPMIDFIQDSKLKNWAGNYTYSTNKVHAPRSVEEVQQLVKSLPKFKVLGTRHCFNSIADSADNFVSPKHLDQVIELNKEARTVTIGAGISYGKLCPYLYEQGFALHNLASLPHISVAGACATATHGSGSHNGNLVTAVRALQMVTPAGDVVTLSREKDGEKFLGAVVGLGALGVVTTLTLDLQPGFDMQQDVFVHLPFAQLKDHLEEIFSNGYSVSLFTDWKSQEANQVWLKRRIIPGTEAVLRSDFFGAVPATRPLHPIEALSAENCTQQMGVPGPWHERLPHFRMNFTPSSGEELQSEYFVPRDKGYEAIMAVNQLRDQIFPHLFISEIRTIDADQLWMSPCYQQPSMAIHFTWKQNWPAVSKLLPKIEAQLAPFNVKPHWGKLFSIAPATLQQRYEKLPAFRQLIKEYDPQGKLRNAFLDTNIYGS